MPDTQKKRQADFDRGLQREEHPLPDGQQGPPEETLSSAHDRRQDDQIEQQGGRVTAIDGFVITPDEVGQTPDQQAPSPYQRLRIHVPQVKTTLSMGQRAPGNAIREADTGAPNYDGFGVHTLGHIFMEAGDDTSTSTATIQAKGHITLQSEKSHVWLGAKESSVLHGGAHVVVNGGGGLFLSAGVMADAPTNPGSDGTVPKVADWLNGIDPAAQKAANFWGNVDMYAGAFEMGATALAGGLDIYHEKGWGKLRALLWTAFQLTVGEIGAGVGDIFSQGTLWPNKLDGSLIMHSKGSMVLGTQNSLGLFSTVGSTLGSATFAGITAPFASVSGVVSFEVQALGGSGSVSAKKEVDVTGGQGVNVMARSGTAALVGETVRIGDPEGGSRQKKTHSVTVTSTDSTIISSMKDATIIGGEQASLVGNNQVGIYGAEVAIDSPHVAINGEKTGITASKRISLACGKTAMTLTPGAAAIGFFGDSAALSSIKGDIKSLKDEHDSLLKAAPRGKGGTIRWSGKKVDGVKVPSGFGNKKKAKFAEVVKNIDKLEAKAAKLKSEKNCIAFSSSGISIIHKGMKMDLDSSKMKVGSSLSVSK